MRVRPLGHVLSVAAVSGVAALAFAAPASAQSYPPITPSPSASPGTGTGGGGGGGGTGTGTGGGGGGGGTGTNGGGLPRTGSDAVVPMLASGLALIAIGSGVVVVSRRRRLELDGPAAA